MHALGSLTTRLIAIVLGMAQAVNRRDSNAESIQQLGGIKSKTPGVDDCRVAQILHYLKHATDRSKTPSLSHRFCPARQSQPKRKFLVSILSDSLSLSHSHSTQHPIPILPLTSKATAVARPALARSLLAHRIRRPLRTEISSQHHDHHKADTRREE